MKRQRVKRNKVALTGSSREFLLDTESSEDSDGEQHGHRVRFKAIGENQDSQCFNVPLSTVTHKFHVSFLGKNCRPTWSEMEHGQLEDILQCLLDFTGKEQKSSDVIDQCKCVPELEDFFHPHMSYLQKDLKTCSQAQLEELTRYRRNLAHALLNKICDAYSCLVLGEVQDYRISQLDMVQMIFNIMADLTGYKMGITYRTEAACQRRVYARVTSKVGKSKIECVSVKPDIVFGDTVGSLHCVPVEIKTTECLRSQKHKMQKDPGHIQAGTSSTDFPKYVERISDLGDCIPTLPCESNTPNQLDSRWKKSLCSQHVMQLLAVADEYYSRIIFHNPSDKHFSFHGMFVFNEYVFFSKMDVGPFYLSKKIAEPPAKLPEFHEKFRESSPRVTFLPVPLDLTQANHRLALLCWMSHHCTQYFTLKIPSLE